MNKYLSVTTILKEMKPFNDKGFISWCRSQKIDPKFVTNESIRMGTKVHHWIENSYYGIESWADGVLTSDKERLYYSMVQEFRKQFKVVESEQRIWCDQYLYTGIYDAQIKDTNTGNIYLADFKTFSAWRDIGYSIDFTRSSVLDKIKSARTQLSMYAYAIQWKGDLAVIVFCPDGQWRPIEVKVDDSWKDWIENNADRLDTLRDTLLLGQGVSFKHDGKIKIKTEHKDKARQEVNWADSWWWTLV